MVKLSPPLGRNDSAVACGRRRRVLFVNHTSEVSGAEMSMLHLARGLCSAGEWEPLLAVANPGPLTELFRDEGIPVRLLPIAVTTAPRLHRIALNVARLRRLVRSENIRLVHANSFHAIKLVCPYAILFGVPFTGSVRDIIPFTRLTSLAIASCDAVACVSKATAKNLATRFPSSRLARIRVVYNGVEPYASATTVDRDQVLRSLGPTTAPAPVVTMISPLVRWKGQQVFLEAAAEAVRRGCQGTFLVVGHDRFAEPGFVDSLHNLADTPELRGRVVFGGFRRDVANVLAASDIVVCPSIAPDPLPRAVLEAMAAAKPVVASHIGGIPEMIRDGVTGYLFTPGASHELAERLLALAHDLDDARAVGRRAAEEVSSRFSLSRHTELMTGLFDQACDRPSSTRISHRPS